MKPSELLQKAKDQLRPETWTQGVYSTNHSIILNGGEPPEECRFCAVGSLSFAAFQTDRNLIKWWNEPSQKGNLYSKSRAYLDSVAENLHYFSVEKLNDHTDFKTVQTMFQTAIDAAIEAGE